MLGAVYGMVELAAYDPAWAERFGEERERLLEALRPEVVRIEHIGSTAVPGLAAKPTLDMLAGLEELRQPEHYTPRLAALGYSFRPDHPAPGRLHYAKISCGSGLPDGRQALRRTHNLSLAVFEGRFWQDHLDFRDYLRSNPEAALAYTRLKRCLAERFPDDTIAYTQGKDEFVASILEITRKRREIDE